MKVVVRDPEEFEQALREFRRKIQEQGLVREIRRRTHYVPPAEARQMKSLRGRRRRRLSAAPRGYNSGVR